MLVRVLACGLCGSDVEKLGREHAGTVLGHEVVARDGGRRRVALVHHRPCGECDALPRRARVDLRASSREATIGPGGFAERVRATKCVDAARRARRRARRRWSSRSPACCAAPSACRAAGCSSSATASSGGCSRAVLERRGDDVFAVDADPRRAGRAPDGPVDAAVVCARGGGVAALEAVEPGGTILVFADAGALPADAVYRKELTLVGSRSATPRVDARGGRAPAVARPAGADGAPARALRRGARALPRARGPEGRVHAVKRCASTAPGDLRIEEVPDPSRAGRRARAGRGRAHRRHRPEGVPPRSPAAARPSRRPRSGTSSAGSTSRPASASSRPTRRRAARARAAGAARRRSASTCYRC